MRNVKFEDRDELCTLTESQVEALKVILENQKRNLLYKDSYSEELTLLSDGGRDDADLASMDMNNNHKIRFRNRDHFYEKKINEALERINKKEYGQCMSCTRTIKYTRLKARPTAELCIICKEEAEWDELKNNPSRNRAYPKNLIRLSSY